MTPAKAIVELDSIPDGDPESAHGDADAILLACLRANEMGDVATAYEAARSRIGFWYA